MSLTLRRAWTDLVLPILQRPRHLQVAALCHRPAASGAGREVLLITSRDTGRWVLPKGWPMAGRAAAEAALQEAWEEAGVVPAEGAVPRPAGSYDYLKRLDCGTPLPVRTQVFSIEVARLEDTFPEAGQRTRRWFPAAEAARLVDEPDLRTLLRGFAG